MAGGAHSIGQSRNADGIAHVSVKRTLSLEGTLSVNTHNVDGIADVSMKTTLSGERTASGKHAMSVGSHKCR